MTDLSIDELMNCVSKASGKSYELQLMDNGEVLVCGYDGEIIDRFTSIAEAKNSYIVF